jgi:hypothetical protein
MKSAQERRIHIAEVISPLLVNEGRQYSLEYVKSLRRKCRKRTLVAGERGQTASASSSVVVYSIVHRRNLRRSLKTG